MSKVLEEIQSELQRRFPDVTFEFSSAFGNYSIVIPKEYCLPVLGHFKNTRRFDFLMDICGVDYPERAKRFEVVYHLFSSKHCDRIRVKIPLAENESLRSVTTLWKGADWFEREAYDMFGIRFDGHPNLKRILCHHQFVGHALRKDYPADRIQDCSEPQPFSFEQELRDQSVEEDWVPLNIGPSHPATHGTLRIMAILSGETIKKADVEIGYLHRCFEKMAETHSYTQVIPFTDRLNYCSAPMNNIGYCKTVEQLLNVQIPLRAQAMRIIFAELSRIIDHFVCIGANAVDIGALTGFFHLFRLREYVYNLFEKYCGARLTVSLTRIGGMVADFPEGWLDELTQTLGRLRAGIDEVDLLLTRNKIWMERTQGVGAVSSDEAIQWGFTGPCLRAAGVNLDLRKATPYYGYESIDFAVPVGTTGDVYDRYLVRMEEMRQSIKIIETVMRNLPSGDFIIRDKSIVLPDKKEVYGNIEGLMNHFMLVIKGIRPPAGEVYDATEAANGELGFYLVSDGTGRPYRLKVRPPCFAIYQSFASAITGGLVADVISNLGSMNIIAGELDR